MINPSDFLKWLAVFGVPYGPTAVHSSLTVLTASTANLTGYTYDNGASGIGATLTAAAPGVLVIDGQTVPLNGTVLYKDDTTYSGVANGIYTLTTLGTVSVAPVLTRSVVYDTPTEMNRTGLIVVQYGTVNANTGWEQSSVVVTIGTTPLVYLKFNTGGSVTSITGTADQVIASAATGAVTLSLPQSIASTSNVVFNSATENVTNNAPIGTTTYTLTAASTNIQYVSTAFATTFTLPDATTLNNGRTFKFYWIAGSTCVVNNNAGSAVMANAGGAGISTVQLVDNSTSNGVWAVMGSITPNTVMLTSFGAFGSTPSASGASISGRTMTLQPASSTQPGGVSTTTQSFAGSKTFINTLTTFGVTGTTLGTIALCGNTSGVVTIQPQAVAGTYNFNLPTTAGTAGQVLTSQGGGSTAMTWTNTITSLSGDNGSATPTSGVITISANGTSAMDYPRFNGSGSTIELAASDANGNTVWGSQSGNASATGLFNCFFGFQSGASLGAGNSNCAFGVVALKLNVNGLDNVAFGNNAGEQLNGGSYNCLIGKYAGYNYTSTESSNIIIGDESRGTIGESNVLRIGAGTGSSQGFINKAFISGINSVTASNAKLVTINSSTDQLGVTNFSATKTASYVPIWDSNVNLSANNFLFSQLALTTSNTTTSLTVSSPKTIYVTGSTSGQTIALPVTSTLVLGQEYEIINNSSVFITVTSSGGNPLVQLMSQGTTLIAKCILTSGTGSTSWFWTHSYNTLPTPASSSSLTTSFGTSLTAGTSVQNTTGVALMLNICVVVSSSTTATLTLGVGNGATPTTSTVVPSFTTATTATYIFSAIVPDLYYVLVNTTGTISISSITVQACGL